MTELTLDNWKEHLKDNRINSYDQITQGYIESFIDQLLTLQKQALKDEAVKRIEEIRKEKWLFDSHNYALSLAQDIIRNLD